MLYRFTGTSQMAFPGLGVTLSPGDEVDLPGPVSSPYLEPVQVVEPEAAADPQTAKGAK